VFLMLFVQLTAIVAGIFLVRLAWWAWRHGRPSRRSDPAARRRAWIWFPWLSLVAAAAAVAFWAPAVLHRVRLPPDMPSSSHWHREAHDVSTDPLRGESRYVRWRVDEPATDVGPLVSRWVEERGMWWISVEDLRARGASRPGTEGPSPCSAGLSMEASPPLFRAGKERLPRPDDPGVSCRVYGRSSDFIHGIVARVTPSTEGSCSVEIWLGSAQDL
jgi:hypothetical protein